MSEKEYLISGIEDKINLLGEQLRAALTEKFSLLEEVSALKNKITDLERLAGGGDRKSGLKNESGLTEIKGEIQKHIDEIDQCVEMLKQL